MIRAVEPGYDPYDPYDAVERMGGVVMAVCEVCGNEYALAFEVHAQGAVHVFDSFECAVHRMAPVCEHCGVRVLGHGVEADGRFFCCRHCAEAEGVVGIVDHA